MNCRICQNIFESRECGMLDSDLCRSCFIKNLSTVFCTGNQLRLCDLWNCKRCFNKSFASSEKCKYWDYESNSKWPIDTARSTDTKYYFNCQKCAHNFEISLSGITCNGFWCQYCSGKKLCNDECKSCFDKSFASHDKSKYWNIIMNKKSARQVFKNSSKKYYFDCTCGHTFDITLYGIIYGNWCSYCANQKLCDSDECKSCFEKSFASHDKSKYWNIIMNKKSVRHVFKNSNKKYYFDCTCGHTFDIALGGITNRNRWCPYCSNPPQRLCDSNECKSCFDKSFASHDKSKHWIDKIPARQVFKSTAKKYKFLCVNNHTFDMTLDHIIRGQWCPKCKNKTECIFLEYLEQTFQNTIYQPKFEWCKIHHMLPFDFQIDKFLIEVDGRQHFIDMEYWTSFAKDVQANDTFKAKCALENGYQMIRISQEYIFKNLGDWKSDIITALHSDEKIQYICDVATMYSNHKHLMES